MSDSMSDIDEFSLIEREQEQEFIQDETNEAEKAQDQNKCQEKE